MPADNTLEARVRARLSELGADGLLRTLAAPSGIDLSSNDYLNLSRHPLVAARLIEGVVRSGCGSTGSRLLRGERECFSALEERFALFKHAARALYFSSGYLANIGLLTALPEAGDVIFSDERNHASLIDGIRLSAARRAIFPHNDVGALAKQLAELRGGHRFVVVESLFSMDGDVAPLAAYAALCRARGPSPVVDEAHAVGVYGAGGSGLVEALGVGGDVLLTVNTAGKALGVAGAFVAGPAWAIEYLVQRARPFVFSTAPPPAVAGALEASLSIVASEPARRTRLLHLARFLRDRLAGEGLVVPPGDSQIVPIVVGDNRRALDIARLMQAGGFDVRAIRPPTVPRRRAWVAVTSARRADTGRFAVTLAAAIRATTVNARPPDHEVKSHAFSAISAVFQ